MTHNNDTGKPARLAADPNTPADILFQLAGQFPEQFCANPVFPLLPLEHPDMATRMPTSALGGLLRYAGVPGDFLSYLAAYGSAEVAEAARLHVNYVTGDAHERRQVLRAAIRRCQEALDAPDLLHELLALDAIPGWLRECLAEDAACCAPHPWNGAACCAPHPWNGAACCAPHPWNGAACCAPTPILPGSSDLPKHAREAPDGDSRHTMAADDDPQVRIAVARNPATPPDLLAWMQQNETMGDTEQA